MLDPKIVNSDVLNYVLSFHTEIPDIFNQIELQAREEKQPIVSKDAGVFLHLMVKLTGAQKILEVGCNIGYSALWFATALPPNGRLDTLEINKETATKAEENFTRANVSNKVFIHIGSAIDLIPVLEGPYDILFIDAAKSQYKDYLRLALPKLKHGALILVDNVLWSGKVANSYVPPDDNMTRALQDFNKYFMEHPELETTILTIGDGLGFGIKKQ
jgi:predicted O-methyltransferase YrrM